MVTIPSNRKFSRANAIQTYPTCTIIAYTNQQIDLRECTFDIVIVICFVSVIIAAAAVAVPSGL